MSYELAKKIHYNEIVFDAHLDLPLEVYYRSIKGEKDILNQHYYNKFMAAGYNFVISAIFIESYHMGYSAQKNALRQIASLLKAIGETDNFMLVQSSDDMKTCVSQNKIGLILSLEGVEPLEGDILILDAFYQLGVRALSLTWSRRNEAGDGSTTDQSKQGGLSDFGRDVVKRCHELGIILDLVHINDQGYDELIEMPGNMFVSHSNSRNVYNHYRNLTDDQVKKLKLHHAIICVNNVKEFIGKENVNIRKFSDHVVHLVELVGAEHVGYGFDRCDTLVGLSPFLTEFSGKSFDLLHAFEESILLTASLLEKGIVQKDVINIIGGNLYRFISKALK